MTRTQTSAADWSRQHHRARSFDWNKWREPSYNFPYWSTPEIRFVRMMVFVVCALHLLTRTS